MDKEESTLKKTRGNRSMQGNWKKKKKKAERREEYNQIKTEKPQ